MSRETERKYKTLEGGFRQKELVKPNLDHIPLPLFHSDPKISILLTQKIYDLVVHSSNTLFKDFQSFYSDLTIEDKYFYSKLCFGYLNYDFYPTFLQNYLLELEKQGEDEGTICEDIETGERSVLGSVQLEYFKKRSEERRVGKEG